MKSKTLIIVEQQKNSLMTLPMIIIIDHIHAIIYRVHIITCSTAVYILNKLKILLHFRMF